MSLPPLQCSIPAITITAASLAAPNAAAAGQNATAPTQVSNVAERHRQHDDQKHLTVKPEMSAAAAASQGEPKA
ncbi:hypothetical protein [Pinirhizobacter sp.]|uniref:hypothetical protein n=1 Tax=Pinirhizobacter sp. TaxID=2950432 RepID=UPI002F423E03